MNDIAVRPVSYGITKDQIEAVRLECENLSAATSGGYIQVKNALVKVTTLLNVLDAERKDLQSVAKAYVDRVNSEARKLRTPLEDIQATLKAKKKAVDDAKAQAKRAKEDAA